MIRVSAAGSARFLRFLSGRGRSAVARDKWQMFTGVNRVRRRIGDLRRLERMRIRKIRPCSERCASYPVKASARKSGVFLANASGFDDLLLVFCATFRSRPANYVAGSSLREFSEMAASEPAPAVAGARECKARDITVAMGKYESL